MNGVPPLISLNPGPLFSEGQTPDQFTRSTYPIIASGSIAPTGHPNTSFPISISNHGNLITNTLTGAQKVGQLADNGNYQLDNGQTGNIFEDEVLKVDYQYGENPFLKNLRAAERQRSIAGSEIPLLRNQLKPLGLTGQGMKIAILDPYEKIEDKSKNPESKTTNLPENELIPSPVDLAAGTTKPQWKISDHSEAVQTVLNDPIWGVAPDATVLHLASIPAEPKQPEADDIREFTNMISSEICDVFDRAAEQLQQALQLHDPALRVVSMTWGTTRTLLYTTVLSLLSEKDDIQEFKYPKMRYAILGPSLLGSVQDRFLAVVNFVDEQIMNSPQIQKAYQSYLNSTQQAAQNGVIPVVSMANDHNIFKGAPDTPPGSEMNLLARSPYVIAVASSDTHQTPGYLTDDTISPFSSSGDGRQFNPTIAAPGQEMGVGRSFGPHGRNTVVNGTSFSAPFTAGVITLMLEANPNLTFEQVKLLLQQTATPVTHSVQREGAGMLNAEKAIRQAMALRIGQPNSLSKSKPIPNPAFFSVLPPIPSPLPIPAPF